MMVVDGGKVPDVQTNHEMVVPNKGPTHVTRLSTTGSTFLNNTIQSNNHRSNNPSDGTSAFTLSVVMDGGVLRARILTIRLLRYGPTVWVVPSRAN